jgi:CDP-glycerol glycerophosphotransferase
MFQPPVAARLGRWGRHRGAVGFSLSAPLPVEQSGGYPQRQLQNACLEGVGPIDPTLVYFASYDGSQPTDSGLAIDQAMRRMFPELRSVWGVADPRTPVPEGSTAVLINSPEWYRVISTAGHLVQNVDFPRWWRKRPGQRFLQTVHGYPAKAMGLMMWRAKEFTPRRLAAELGRTSAGWDLILTPAPEMDQYYRREYAYQGPICNQGYPRDDDLVLPSAGQRRDRVRELLDIAPEQKVILYAPTWRDHLASSYRSAELVDKLDVASASARLGDQFVLLLRGHRFTSTLRRTRSGTTKIIDVTDYPEISDLILAADAAVLDYSSLRFDFALTGRPMVFLVPDLADYTGGIRGFLFDYIDTAPGPLATTADDAITALQDLDQLAERYRDQIAAFNARYQYLQDGHAAERVVRQFFADPHRHDHPAS